MTDEELVRGIRDGKSEYFETVMRRYNQRLFRVARAIVRDDDEAEDVIAIHEALGRVRKSRRVQQFDDATEGESVMGQLAALHAAAGRPSSSSRNR